MPNTIVVICTAINSVIFTITLVFTMLQLRRANRTAQLEIFRSWRDSYILSNHTELHDPRIQALFQQTPETAFLHGMLAQYEYAWRCWSVGELSDQEFERYAIAIKRLRDKHKLKEALDVAIQPFDRDFEEFVRTGELTKTKKRRRFLLG